MKVNSKERNLALVSLYQNPHQVITMDASFIISPHRQLARSSISFPIFCECWLTPIFDTFPNLAIHEAVYNELVSRETRSFIDTMIQANPPRIKIHKDSELTNLEQALRNSFEAKISQFTQYKPSLDNRNDRGEVKTLAFIAVKGLLYFAAHDHNAILMIENAEAWGTGLDGIQAIKMYELIYFLSEKYPHLKKSLRILYRYQYYLTDYEKTKNPSWVDFIQEMESLYQFEF